MTTSSASTGTEVELTATGVAAGGDAVARQPDGRVVFVRGALPGESVRARVTEVTERYARAATVAVLDPSPDRIAPPCPHVADGCGGCGWQHVRLEAQPALKERILSDALERIGGVREIRLQPTVTLPGRAYRTSARLRVKGGRAAYYAAGTHERVGVEHCLVAHPLLDEMIAEGRFPGAREVELRVGARTGERLAVIYPTAAGTALPTDVTTVGADRLRARRGERPSYHEIAAGRRWRISAGAFFQIRPDGADVLADLVVDAVGDAGRVVDLCAGVGLFSGVVAARGGQVTAVEADRVAVADARQNLADVGVSVVRADLDSWRAQPAEAIVADPPRRGLRAAGAATVVATGARTVVLVSCDPAAGARDVGLLVAAGYALEHATPVDLFPGTPHVESVFVLSRPAGAAAATDVP